MPPRFGSRQSVAPLHWRFARIAPLLGMAIWPAQRSCGANSYADVIAAAQPRMVKIFGAGGLRALEHYQSGFLISAEGHILTAWSYVLDTADVAVTLADGRRKPATLCILVTSTAEKSSSSGNNSAIASAIMVLPTPGGPTISRLCPPAAAMIAARFAES